MSDMDQNINPKELENKMRRNVKPLQKHAENFTPKN